MDIFSVQTRTLTFCSGKPCIVLLPFFFLLSVCIVKSLLFNRIGLRLVVFNFFFDSLLKVTDSIFVDVVFVRAELVSKHEDSVEVLNEGFEGRYRYPRFEPVRRMRKR
jgi:hypothetical protein